MKRLARILDAAMLRGDDASAVVARELRIIRNSTLDLWHDTCDHSQLIDLICEEQDRRLWAARKVAA